MKDGGAQQCNEILKALKKYFQMQLKVDVGGILVST